MFYCFEIFFEILNVVYILAYLLTEQYVGFDQIICVLLKLPPYSSPWCIDLKEILFLLCTHSLLYVHSFLSAMPWGHFWWLRFIPFFPFLIFFFLAVALFCSGVHTCSFVAKGVICFCGCLYEIIPST